MDRRDRKREKHRIRRKERRKELRVRRDEQARHPRIVEEPPSDLRGLSALEWDDYRTLTFAAVVERARELFPRDHRLKHVARSRFGSLSAGDADDMEAILTIAARTLRSDPPWHWPCVIQEREPDLVFYMNWKRSRRKTSSEGSVGFWDLVLPDPAGGTVEVGFTRHAIDRLTERLGVDNPVSLRVSADVWMMFLEPLPDLETIAVLRAIVEREGETVLTLRLRCGDEERELGYFPLLREDGVVVAKTFLEPWMTGPRPAVKYSADERRRFEQCWLDETVPWFLAFCRKFSALLLGDEHFAGYLEGLKRAYRLESRRSTLWFHTLRDGEACFDQEKYRQARPLLERGLKLYDEEVAHADAVKRSVFDSDKMRRAMAAHRYLLAQTYSMAAAGALDPEHPEATPVPEEAARLLAIGREILAHALKDRPDLLQEADRQDPDVARLLAAE